MDRTTMSRRNALRTGGLAAIAASLLGTADATPAVAAAPLPSAAASPVLGTVTDTAHLVAESTRLAYVCRETMTKLGVAGDALPAWLTEDEEDLFRAYDDAMSEHYSATLDLYLAELYRHFPGLAPALSRVAEHIQEGFNVVGACCMPDVDGAAS